jgi:hypothetical protein
MRVVPLAPVSHFGFIRACFLACVLVPLCALCTHAQTQPNFQRDYIYDAQGRLINTVEKDTYGPFAPTGVSASFDDGVCGVDVDWNATTDLGGSGVAKYLIFRNSSQAGQTTGLSFVDYYSIRGSYAYTVKGVDNAGNIGPASAPAYAIIQLCSPHAPVKKPPSNSALTKSSTSDSNRSLLARLGIPAFFRGVRNVTVAGFKNMTASGGGK